MIGRIIPIIEEAEERVIRAFHSSKDTLTALEETPLQDPLLSVEDVDDEIDHQLLQKLMVQHD